MTNKEKKYLRENIQLVNTIFQYNGACSTIPNINSKCYSKTCPLFSKCRSIGSYQEQVKNNAYEWMHAMNEKYPDFFLEILI